MGAEIKVDSHPRFFEQIGRIHRLVLQSLQETPEVENNSGKFYVVVEAPNSDSKELIRVMVVKLDLNNGKLQEVELHDRLVSPKILEDVLWPQLVGTDQEPLPTEMVITMSAFGFQELAASFAAAAAYADKPIPMIKRGLTLVHNEKWAISCQTGDISQPEQFLSYVATILTQGRIRSVGGKVTASQQ